MLRFTFPERISSLIFDADGLSLNPEEGELSGYTGAGKERTFLYATFDQPVQKGDSSSGGAYYRFDTSESRTVTMRIATSRISLAQARKNLKLEIAPGDTFQDVRSHAQGLWDDKLDVITDVEGANPDQLTSLYSGLYRLNLRPGKAYENTGTVGRPKYEYASSTLPAAGKATDTRTGAQVVTGKKYDSAIFWDAYRTSWPAYDLFYWGLHSGHLLRERVGDA